MRGVLKIDHVLPYLERVKQSRGRQTAPVFTVNIAPVFAEIINKGFCTKRELEEYYSYTDALDMYEILAVERLNEAAARGEAMMAPRHTARTRR